MAKGESMRTILAAVADTGASGQVAARTATVSAWLLAADVVPFHACYEPALSGGAFFDSPRLAAARREYVARSSVELEEIAKPLKVEGLEVRARVEWARSVPDAVARAAARERAVLVVAAVNPGAHGLRPSSLDVGVVRLAASIARATRGSASVRCTSCTASRRRRCSTSSARPTRTCSSWAPWRGVRSASGCSAAPPSSCCTSRPAIFCS